MQFNLVPHPTTPPSDPGLKLWATVDHAGAFGAMATTNIWFGIGAPAAHFVIPQLSEPWRADELWKSTCFEAFLKTGSETDYREWNFSPTGNWAAYDFTGYRSDMAKAEIENPPYIRMEDNFTWWAVGATIAVESEPQWQLGLSAVLEEKNGTKSYWALEHSNQEAPDFHLADCFIAKLA